VEKQETWSYST